MQIIQWFQKVVVAHEPPKESPRVNTSSPTKKESCTAKSKGILSLSHLGANQRRKRMLKKEDTARGLRNTNNKPSDLVANHVGNTKVLPLTDAAISPSTNQCGKDEKGDQRAKSDKSKTLSKMKELLRWAAAAKSEKGGKYISRKVLQFRNRGALKSVPDDEQLSNDSPKISFRWELESCSTTSSVYSALSKASSKRITIDQNTNTTPSTTTPKSGNWITTDSDFVVLEL